MVERANEGSLVEFSGDPGDGEAVDDPENGGWDDEQISVGRKKRVEDEPRATSERREVDEES